MFINLSNHCSSRWEENQLSAARQYGSIKDIPFPSVPPRWTEAEVASLAAQYYRQCKEYATTTEEVVFHIAGEPVFCFFLIQQLLEDGFKVLASTTERIVRENEKEKIVRFEFVCFREYKLINNRK